MNNPKVRTVIFSEVPFSVFSYNDYPYMKIVPSKKLFNSTMVHEVVTRGDFFAVNLITGIFTVLPQGADKNEQPQSNSKPARVKKPVNFNKDLFPAAD